MNNYDLVLMVTDEEGARTGEQIRVASIRGTRTTGRMRVGVERTVRIGVMRMGISGENLLFSRRDADIVAASLSLDRSAFREAGIDKIGTIVAMSMKGEEVKFRLTPERMDASDVLVDDSAEDLEASVD